MGNKASTIGKNQYYKLSAKHCYKINISAIISDIYQKLDYDEKFTPAPERILFAVV